MKDAVDPDPTKQSPEERLATRQTKIREARRLLSRVKYKAYFEGFADPFFIARAAASSKRKIAVNELVNAALDPQHMKILSALLIESLDKSLKTESQWLLNGRAASVITDGDSHRAEFWIYFEDKWRISPEI